MTSTGRTKAVPFTAMDICSIIKECGVSGVAEFTLDKLHIIFSYKPEVPVPQQVVSENNFKRPEPSPRELYERALDEAKILDPPLYERMLEVGFDDEAKDG